MVKARILRIIFPTVKLAELTVNMAVKQAPHFRHFSTLSLLIFK